MKDLIEKFWITDEGYPAVVRFNQFGCRVAYVGVPPTHKLYKKDCRYLDNIKCHGTLDFSSTQFNNGGLKNYPAKDPKYDDYWFFGFCADHCWDAQDVEGYKRLHGEEPFKMTKYEYQIIRTLDFMVNNCNSISKQLKGKQDEKI